MDKLLSSSYRLTQVLILLILMQMCTSERCAYRVFSSGSKSRHRHNDDYLPTEIAFKECPWGCCWDQKESVCCLFPMDVVVFAFIATLAAIVVITLVIILLCYVHVRRNRSTVDSSGPVVRQRELGHPYDLLYPKHYHYTLIYYGYPENVVSTMT